jgi:hypothetical protein
VPESIRYPQGRQTRAPGWSSSKQFGQVVIDSGIGFGLSDLSPARYPHCALSVS